MPLRAGQPLDHRRGFNRTGFARGFDDFFGERGLLVGIQFIDIKAARFPVLMQTKRKIKARLPLQPLHVRPHLRRLQVPVIAIQVRSLPRSRAG